MILDTNAVSALIAGEPELGSLLEGSERHHLPAVVIGEYRYRLLQSRHRAVLEAVLGTLIHESKVLRVDEVTAEHYGAVRSELREAGRPIPENDVWIAALARQHLLPVISRDSHFDRVAGLQRLSW